MGIRSSIFLMLALVFLLHVNNAREVPKPKNTENLVNVTSIENNNSPNDGPKKEGGEVNDDKHFIAFAGMGAAGGVGGAAGIIPVDLNGIGTIPTFGGGGLGSGLGGGGGAGGIGGGGGAGGIGGGGVGGGCPTTTTSSTSTGGLVPIP